MEGLLLAPSSIVYSITPTLSPLLAEATESNQFLNP
jgi:hypothetical protein